MALSIGRKIELPEEGIHTPDGFLFHHVGTVHLDSEQIARLHEYGIGYRFGARFKPEEDEIIRNNWAKFAAEYDLDPNSVLIFCGKGDRKGNDVFDEKKRRQFCLDTDFWPRMCQFLPHRSGNMVKRRMIRIFDPAVVAGHAEIQFGKPNEFTWDEVVKLKELYEMYHGDFDTIAKVMNKPYTACYSAYEKHVKNHPSVSREQWKALWDVVCNHTEDSIPSKVRKALAKGNREKLERITVNIDFQKVAKTLLWKEEHCKSAWQELLEEFTKEYEEERSNYEDSKQVWTAIFQKAFKVRKHVSPEQFCTFVRMVSKCLLDENDRTSNLRIKHIDLDRLSKKMVARGITGFYTRPSSISEVEYLLSKLRRVLSRCEVQILSRLVIKYTLKERLQIAYRALDRQMGEKVLTHQGFAFVSTWAYMESLIVFTKKLDENWIPPSKFKKYVKDEDVLALFSDVGDNSALLSHAEYQKLLQDYEELPGEVKHEEEERMDCDE